MVSPLFATVLAGWSPLFAQSPESIRGHDPVTVSAANYRDTSRDDLHRAVNAPETLNPEGTPPATTREPQTFVFMPGEIYASDVTFEQLCEILTPALEQRRFINAADAAGRIRDPDNISLLLRVSYGNRPWRLPTVRTDRLTWADGMQPRPRGRSLTTLGGDVIWDQRAGGNDDAMAQAQAAEATAAGNFGFSGQTAGRPGAGGGSGGSTSLSTPGTAAGAAGTGLGSTRDFHLIVIDAFDHQEVKRQGRRAKRLWTTFVSAPRKPGQNLSEIVHTLVRNATPYFGETSRGLQIYTDARADVTIGEATVVDD